MKRKLHLTSILAIAGLLLAVPGCSVNVKKDQAGENKNVDIETPFGGIHVDENVDVRDTGLPVYPGARLKPKEDTHEDKSANVNISAGNFGLRVVAVQYETDDPPAKVQAFYQDQLKKFGTVLECRSSEHHVGYGRHSRKESSDELKCEGDSRGKNIELKVGTESNQHIVAIEPKEKGTDFALVYVRTRGKEGSI